MGTRLLTELSSPRVMSIMKNNKDLFKTNKNTVQILSRCIRKKKQDESRPESRSRHCSNSFRIDNKHQTYTNIMAIQSNFFLVIPFHFATSNAYLDLLSLPGRSVCPSAAPCNQEPRR